LAVTWKILPINIPRTFLVCSALATLSVHLKLYTYLSIRNWTRCSNHKVPLNFTS